MLGSPPSAPSSERAGRCPAGPCILSAPMQKPPPGWAGVSGLGSLTITYFHTGIRTIIGVESFHGPVRDGKGWDRLAMVIRQRGLSRCFATRPIWEEAVIQVVCITHENPTRPTRCHQREADLL